jgi:hypothetical protein
VGGEPVEQVVGGLRGARIPESDDQVDQLHEGAKRADVPVSGGGQLAEGLVDGPRLVGPAGQEQRRGSRGMDDRDRRGGRQDLEEIRLELGGVAAEGRHRESERIGHARSGEVLDPDRELAGLLRPVSCGAELAGQRRPRGLLAQQVPADQRQPGRFGQLRDQGDLRVDRLEVH